ncbi:MAG: hypothetical protein GVY36_05055 [Verrucomicrobia bacterium]|jgi:predicted nucleic acid-binding protein|nr:hypothetical protein [Verrucomicrobiota bacterium]
MRQLRASLVGLDTAFLVAHTILEHSNHPKAVSLCQRFLSEGRILAICPTVADEFLHVVTDPRRFECALTMHKALQIVRTWMQSQETICLLPTMESNRLHLDWMAEHRLGRKRINDTRIASIYFHHGVPTLLTSNTRDFSIFEAFDVIKLCQ